jgi:hypothetical protein
LENFLCEGWISRQLHIREKKKIKTKPDQLRVEGWDVKSEASWLQTEPACRKEWRGMLTGEICHFLLFRATGPHHTPQWQQLIRETNNCVGVYFRVKRKQITIFSFAFIF